MSDHKQFPWTGSISRKVGLQALLSWPDTRVFLRLGREMELQVHTLQTHQQTGTQSLR